MYTPNLEASMLNTIRRPLHTKAHGDHRYDICPTCLATIDQRSIEVEFPPFKKLVLGNLGTGGNTMSNRRLTFFERLSIDTEVKRNDTEHSYINSTQVDLILEFLGIKHEGSDLANFKYDYDSADRIISIDDLPSEMGANDDMLVNIKLGYDLRKIKFIGDINEEREHRRSQVSNAFGEMSLKALEKCGKETKEMLRQKTLLAIKKVLQPANDPVMYEPFFANKSTHNQKTRLIKQLMKNEIENRSLISKNSFQKMSLEDLMLGVLV